MKTRTVDEILRDIASVNQTIYKFESDIREAEMGIAQGYNVYKYQRDIEIANQELPAARARLRKYEEELRIAQER